MTADAKANTDIEGAKGLLGSEYAKRLMAMVNEIRATGAASLDIDLPTIVVAGNQSSGKSSLIEALSGIHLPRATGTCTRVPMEVRLAQRNVDWSCTIKIRHEDHLHLAKSTETLFGTAITDPTLVETAIRRAQLAILNPSVSPDLFVDSPLPKEGGDLPLGSTKQLSFSNNVVVLEITGREMTDLTLVDLPGIIQNVDEKEDKGDIILIENMVKGYIQKDCLILLVITMKDDYLNQKAALLAKDADPEGKRTIGVLTKVDTVTDRVDIDDWLKMVRNEKGRLAHGYFVRLTLGSADPKVTRLPAPNELKNGITIAEAREQEKFFFSGQAPWSELDLQTKKRLGTNNLASYLSVKLSNLIKDKLPQLERQITSRHNVIETELQALGKEPSDDPTGVLLGMLTKFEWAIAQHVDGLPGDTGLIQSINKLNTVFVEEVWETKPSFIPDERAKAASNGEDPPSKAMYLDDMQSFIDSCRTRELPNQLPPSAVATLIKRYTSTWQELARDHLEMIKPVVQTLLDGLIRGMFGKYSHGGLPEMISTIVNDCLQVLSSRTTVFIDVLVAMERRPFTLNTHYLDANSDKYLAQLKDQRTASQAAPEAAPRGAPTAFAISSPGPPMVAATPAIWNPVFNPSSIFPGPAVVPSIVPKPITTIPTGDQYATEMRLMAETSAYWKVAFKRLIDNIPRMIDLKLLTQLPVVIRAALLKDLHVLGEGSHIRCRALLDEAPDIADQRRELTVRRAQLGNAKLAVRKFKLT